MTITAHNKGTQSCEMAINKWGSTGSTKFYTLKPSCKETWARTDWRGFVLSVRFRGSVSPYFVLPSSTIEFNDGNIIIDGKAPTILRASSSADKITMET